MAETLPQLGLAAVFTLLFVTLGPVKLMGPFAQASRDLDEAALKRIALLTFSVGTTAALVGGITGKILLESWQISIPAITLTGGIIFFLVGMRLVLEPYAESSHPSSPAPLPTKPVAAAFRLAFPLLVTPYGLAAVIALLANTTELERMASIVAILIAVMLMNLVAMVYIRRIMGPIVGGVLHVVGATLAVLQVALAVQFILRGLRELNLL
jgi:multiple antibiotic resistance protein